MKLWIDTEFNGLIEHYRSGDLISMALVDEAGKEWYEVLECAKPEPWIADHVVPILDKAPISIGAFKDSLAQYLRGYDYIHLIADWPADVANFCDALIVGPGLCMYHPPLTFEIVSGLEIKPAVPHNALSDARAIRDAYLVVVSELGTP